MKKVLAVLVLLSFIILFTNLLGVTIKTIFFGGIALAVVWAIKQFLGKNYK